MSLDLSFPRRPYVEAYLGGDWRNLTADVRQKPGIKVTRGQRNEGSAATPGKCTFVLDDGPEHGNGYYSPRNPLGQWYGTLGRNNPVRVGLEVGRDTFTRTVTPGGWGDSEQNGAWSSAVAGTASTSVSGGEGLHSVSTTSSYALSYLDFPVRDIDVSVTVTIDSVSTVTGDALEPANIVLHGQSTSSFYLVRLEVVPSHLARLSIMLNDTTTLAGPFTLPDAYGGEAWRVRAAMEQGHIVAKAWPAANPEPLKWQVESIRDNPYGSGFVGVRSGVAAGNTNTKPIIFRYDDFELRLPRFAGEMAGFTPSSDLTHNVRQVAVECGGLLRRVLKYQKQLESPVKRWLLSGAPTTPVQYWSLEELPTASTQGVDELGGIPAAFVRGTSGSGPVGAIKWGTTDNVPPSIVAAPELTAGGQLVFGVPVNADDPSTAGWSVSWGQRISADAGCRIWLRTIGNSGNSGWQIIIYTNGDLEIYELTTGTLEITTSLESLQLGFDNVWHSMTFTTENNSGSADFFLYIDNVGVGGNAAGQPQSKLRRIELTSETGTTAPSAYSHVAVYPDALTSFEAFDYFDAFFGWGGAAQISSYTAELYLTRFIRLCTEQGIAYSRVGPEAAVPRIGPQTPNPIGTLLLECAQRDATVLHETRVFPAVAIRRTDTLYNQTSIATLDYSAGHMAPPFAPVDDDLEPLNDVTVKATYTGAEARYEKTSGPNNVNDPGTTEGAVGRYDKTANANVDLDSKLGPLAGWLVHLGTVDEPRFPALTVDLRAEAVTDTLAASLLEANIGDQITLANLADTLLFDDLDQLVRGYTETFDTAYQHVIQFNVSPASPYRIGIFDQTGHKFTINSSTLAADYDAGTDTSFQVALGGSATWSHADGDFEVGVGGVRVNVTAVSGTGPQTFTVDPVPLNGVSKTVPAGTPVRLANPVYFGLGG